MGNAYYFFYFLPYYRGLLHSMTDHNGCIKLLQRHYFLKSFFGLLLFVIINVAAACVFYATEQLSEETLDGNDLIHGGRSSCLKDHGFWGALFHSFSLSTTIGYCRLQACTKAGRAITAVYCLASLPFTILVLKDLGYKLCIVIAGLKYFIQSRCSRCCNKSSSNRNHAGSQPKSKPKTTIVTNNAGDPFSTKLIHTPKRQAMVQIALPTPSRSTRGRSERSDQNTHSESNGYIVELDHDSANGSLQSLSEISLEIGEAHDSKSGVRAPPKPAIFSHNNGGAFETFVPELLCVFLLVAWYACVAMYIHVVHNLAYTSSFYYSTMFFLLREYFLSDFRYTAASFLVLFVGLILLSTLINAIYWNSRLVIRFCESDIFSIVFDNYSIGPDDGDYTSSDKNLIKRLQKRQLNEKMNSFRSNRSFFQLDFDSLTQLGVNSLLSKNGAHWLIVKIISDFEKNSLKQLYERCISTRKATILSMKQMELDRQSENDVSLNNQLILPSSTSYILSEFEKDANSAIITEIKSPDTINILDKATINQNNDSKTTAEESAQNRSTKYADKFELNSKKSLFMANYDNKINSIATLKSQTKFRVENGTQCELINALKNGVLKSINPSPIYSEIGIQCKPEVHNSKMNTFWINPGTQVLDSMNLKRPSFYDSFRRHSPRLKSHSFAAETQTTESSFGDILTANGHPPDPELGERCSQKSQIRCVEMVDKNVQFTKAVRNVTTSTNDSTVLTTALNVVTVDVGTQGDDVSPGRTIATRRSNSIRDRFPLISNNQDISIKPLVKNTATQSDPETTIVQRNASTECDLANATLSDSTSQTLKIQTAQRGSQCSNQLALESQRGLDNHSQVLSSTREILPETIRSLAPAKTNLPSNVVATRDCGSQKIIPSFTKGSQNVPDMANAGSQVKPEIKDKKQQFPEITGNEDDLEEPTEENNYSSLPDELEVTKRQSGPYEGYRPLFEDFDSRKSWNEGKKDIEGVKNNETKIEKAPFLKNIDRKSPYLFRD